MLIAKEKRKKNIAEYILYMWQVEDIIRAAKFDIRIIEQSIINQYAQPIAVKNEIKRWYENLMEMMVKEKITGSGHLQIIKQIIFDLFDLHLFLLNSPTEMKYVNLYNKAIHHIHIYNSKLQGTAGNEIDICFNALYAWLLLRISKKEITAGTEEAFKAISNLLAALSQRYHEREEEERG